MSLEVGQSAEVSKTITDEDIRAFAELSGDRNPVHLDDEYAARTRFGRRVAHGMLAASLLSAVLANELPGRGTVYLSQSLRFTAPVYPGDTVTARVTVKSAREDKPVVTLETVCTNQRGERVIEGEAVVLASRQKAEGSSATPEVC
jgi:3-hydroxybutyryl-CoA dehydratase